MSLISIARYFYRNRTLAVILLLALLAAALLAQKKPARRGPRATAIVVMSADGKSANRLIPVCIRDNDQFWDASIYQATPRPMALEPGIVYEVARSGEPIGLFVVRTPTNENGAWVASGKWEPPRKNTGPLSSLPVADPDVPVLRRTKPPADEQPAARPALPAPPSPDQDPDRPELKRGKPAEKPEPSPTPNAPVKAPAPKVEPASVKPPELLAAISDAAGPDPHTFLLDLKPDEQSKLRSAALALAQTAIAKQAALAPDLHLDIKTPAVHYFDLDGNNNPEVVLNGIATVVLPTRPGKAKMPPSKDFYVTVIGREDLSGEVHLVFSRVVSARNTEFDGRLELVDAVDVDGDGRGELLFRRLIGRDVSYLVLKVGLRQTTTLFDSSGR